jgi:aspartate 1-decarboxylase
MLKSKIHRATVTDRDVDYIGSIVIEGEAGSGAMQVNGAAAHLTEPGHRIIVASFGAYDEDDLGRYSPLVVHLDDANRPAVIDNRPEVLLA